MNTTKEVLKHIKNMDSAERFKIVKEIAEFSHGSNEKILVELLDELIKVKQDIEFLSRKIGIHDMYFNRIKDKEIQNNSIIDKKLTSKKLMEVVMNLDSWESNAERQKFLTEMFYEFFNRSNHPRVEEDWGY